MTALRATIKKKNKKQKELSGIFLSEQLPKSLPNLSWCQKLVFIWEGHFCQGNQILHVYRMAVVGEKEGKMGFCFIGPNQQQFVLTQLFSYSSQKGKKKKASLIAKPRLRAAAFKAEKLSRCRCNPRSLAGHWYGGYRANTAFCHHMGRDFANKNGGRLIVLAQSSNRGIERRFRFSVVK